MSASPVSGSSAAEELAALLQRMGHRSARRADRDDLRALPALYRRVVARLAEARARDLDPAFVRYLQDLVLRAHSLLYAPEPARLGRSLAGVLTAFPATVRRYLRHLGLATLLLVMGAVWGYVEVRRDPASAAVLLSGSMEENARSFTREGVKRAGDPIYGVFYFTNNARVAFLAYALGATLGIGTVLVLVFNGILLGATAAVVAQVGSPAVFISFVAPHGGVEIFAILVAAAGGLAMADGFLRPGWDRRRDGLARAARESLPLALGGATLLLGAGLVEGWVSPLPWTLTSKVSFGLLLDLMLVAYLWVGWRVDGVSPPSRQTRLAMEVRPD